MSTNEELNSADRRAVNLELYKMAAQTRAQEIGFYWQRSNYLLVLNTAIAGGLVTLRGTAPPLAVLLSIVGLIVSFLWLLVNIGGKFWQCRWEQCVEEAEKRYAPDAEVFSAGWKRMVEQVETNLTLDEPAADSRWITRVLYRVRILHRKWIIARPSVSEVLTGVSVVFVMFWCGAFIYTLYMLCTGAPVPTSPTS